MTPRPLTPAALAWALAPLGVGLALTAVLATSVQKRAEAGARRQFDERVHALTGSIERSFDVSLQSLHAVSALRRAYPSITALEFQTFARDLMRAQPSLAGLEWAELVPDERRESFESEQSRGLGRPFAIKEPRADGSMGPASRRERYAPLVLLEPFVAALEGLDVRFEPSRRKAVDGALANRTLLATGRFQLVEDPPGVYSVAVYDARPPARGETPSGLSIALYRIEPLVKGALGGLDLTAIDLALVDEDAEVPADRILYLSRADADFESAGRFVLTAHTRFVGRRWTVRCATTPPIAGSAAAAVMVGGTLASLLLALLISLLQSHRRLQRELLAERQLGAYTLTRKLGVGGMGEVFEATHHLLRRRVAVKVIRTDQTVPALAERFAREARTMSQLSHPNTITLYDYGIADDGRLYVAMEYLDGITFEELITRHGAQPPARVRHLIVQVCRALAEAHEAGVVHRDIKPGNVMLCLLGGQHDFVKVLDFGLAKSVRPGDAMLSRAGTPVGTFSHMAPECILEPTSASPLSDLYSVGCVLYELLAGRALFPGLDRTALVAAHLSRKPDALDPERVSAGLVTIVMRCLEKDPLSRFQSARQLAAALNRLELPKWTESDAADWWARHRGASPVEEEAVASQLRPAQP